jgi:hypothetical protein
MALKPTRVDRNGIPVYDPPGVNALPNHCPDSAHTWAPSYRSLGVETELRFVPSDGLDAMDDGGYEWVAVEWRECRVCGKREKMEMP